jgi:hypothetical protein
MHMHIDIHAYAYAQAHAHAQAYTLIHDYQARSAVLAKDQAEDTRNRATVLVQQLVKENTQLKVSGNTFLA